MSQIKEDEEDVGTSPIVPTRWKAGESGNAEGKPKGTKNLKPRSRMRQTLTKLYEIQGPAIDVLNQVITGKDKNGKKSELTKEQIEAAKFVVKSIESLNITCLKEEMDILKVRREDEQSANDLENNQADTTKEIPPAFSMEMAENALKH